MIGAAYRDIPSNSLESPSRHSLRWTHVTHPHASARPSLADAFNAALIRAARPPSTSSSRSWPPPGPPLPTTASAPSNASRLARLAATAVLRTPSSNRPLFSRRRHHSHFTSAPSAPRTMPPASDSRTSPASPSPDTSLPPPHLAPRIPRLRLLPPLHLRAHHLPTSPRIRRSRAATLAESRSSAAPAAARISSRSRGVIRNPPADRSDSPRFGYTSSNNISSSSSTLYPAPAGSPRKPYQARPAHAPYPETARQHLPHRSPPAQSSNSNSIPTPRTLTKVPRRTTRPTAYPPPTIHGS